MKSTHGVLLAGVALIVACNAVALGGAWYNRTGAAESTLKLSERELTQPRPFWGRDENSGTTLRLAWRVQSSATGQHRGYDLFGFNRDADWLTPAKLDELGLHPRPTGMDSRGFRRTLPVRALLVLELNGPAYRENAERGCHDPEPMEAEAAKNNCDYAMNGMPRLFVVDSGLDREALRRRYPDTSMYAIVHGRVSASYSLGTTNPINGWIDGIDNEDLNVPRTLRIGTTLPAFSYFAEHRVPVQATVSFGRRLEPWLVDLKQGENDR